MRFAEEAEGVGLAGAVLGKPVGVIGGAGGVDRKVVALGALLRVGLDGEQRAREPDPVLGALASVAAAVA